jgi:hypothetical protein
MKDCVIISNFKNICQEIIYLFSAGNFLLFNTKLLLNSSSLNSSVILRNDLSVKYANLRV